MPWIKIENGFQDHPKVDALSVALDVDHAWMHVVAMWLWVARVKADGDLAGIADKTIAKHAAWTGDASHFVGAMTNVGFLEGPEGARVVCGWAERYGSYLERAERDRGRKQRVRADTVRTSATRPQPVGAESARRSEENRSDQITEEASPKAVIGSISNESLLAGAADLFSEAARKPGATRDALVALLDGFWRAEYLIRGSGSAPAPNRKQAASWFAEGVLPSDIAKAIRGMRADTWEGRPARREWNYVARQMATWLDHYEARKPLVWPDGGPQWEAEVIPLKPREPGPVAGTVMWNGFAVPEDWEPGQFDEGWLTVPGAVFVISLRMFVEEPHATDDQRRAIAEQDRKHGRGFNRVQTKEATG